MIPAGGCLKIIVNPDSYVLGAFNSGWEPGKFFLADRAYFSAGAPDLRTGVPDGHEVRILAGTRPLTKSS